MQVDLNSYSLDDIFKHLKFEDMKDKEIDFIDFSRKWIAKATIKEQTITRPFSTHSLHLLDVTASTFQKSIYPLSQDTLII